MLRKISALGASIFTLVLIFVFASAAQQQNGMPLPFNPDKVLVSITKAKLHLPLKTVSGTGFCLTSDCDLVVTSYHVVALANRPPTVRGERVVESDLATGPTDHDAVPNHFFDPSPGHAIKYASVRDLAIFRVNRPLAKIGMHGISFNPQQLQYGQEVDIFGFTESNLPALNERKLAKFLCTFVRESSEGLLEFRCDPSRNDKPIEPGESGGLVIDSKTQQAVGILEGIGDDKNNLAIAVPVWSLADFVKRFQPQAYPDLFSKEIYRPSFAIPPSDGIDVKSILPDKYMADDPSELISPPASAPTGLLQSRKEESPEIQSLRSRAQELADGMRNFVAVQTLSQGGGNTAALWSQYEITVVNGNETLRDDDPSGTQKPADAPLPPVGLVFGHEWADLPNTIGTKLNLKIWQAQDKTVNGHQVKVFLYRAESEDHVCRDTSTMNYGLFRTVWSGAVACSGEVWTDDDMNILRISQDLFPPPSKTKWTNLHTVVAYGWLKEPEEQPKLVPARESFQGELDRRIYWSNATFANYREFGVKSKLMKN